jgi:hypothetical protein
MDWGLHVPNDMTDRIYFAANDGQILCLRPRDSVKPLIMKTVVEAKPEEKKKRPEKKKEEKKKEDEKKKDEEKEKAALRVPFLPSMASLDVREKSEFVHAPRGRRYWAGP